MRVLTKSVQFLLAPILLGLFLWSGSLARQEQKGTRQELVAPPLAIQYFQFSFRFATADVLWIRALQDFDFCENLLQKNLCGGRGWVYQTLNLITDLDPRFRMAFSAGGMALSVMISDIQGASLFFDKAVLNFPTDWQIAYKAAYHALYEEKNKEKAARLMKIAAENGAPDWVYILAGRLYTDAGQKGWAEKILLEMKDLGLSQELQERLRQKIQE